MKINISGISIFTVLFVGLKLTHYIDWSWWWVLAPTWIPITFALCLISFAVLMSVVTGGGVSFKYRKVQK